MTDQHQQLPAAEPVGNLEVVALFDGPMQTGVTVSHEGRIFVNFPKWGDDVQFTVGELRAGKAVAYPDQKTNTTDPNDPAAALVSLRPERRRRPQQPAVDSRHGQPDVSADAVWWAKDALCRSEQ